MDIAILHKTLIIAGIAPADTTPDWDSMRSHYEAYAHKRGYSTEQPAFVGLMPTELQMAYNEVLENPKSTDVALKVIAEDATAPADSIETEEQPEPQSVKNADESQNQDDSATEQTPDEETEKAVVVEAADKQAKEEPKVKQVKEEPKIKQVKEEKPAKKQTEASKTKKTATEDWD